MEKLGLTPVSHDELVEFTKQYPWKTEWRYNPSDHPSYAFWEPPDFEKKRKAVLVAIKKFRGEYKGFDDEGDCFILLNPSYSDDNGREWRKIDERLMVVIAVAGRQCRNGQVFSQEELMSVAGANPRAAYRESDKKLFFEMGFLAGNPPYLTRGKLGVVIDGI